MELTLLRLEQDPTKPQRGVIIAEGSPRWATLELPWLDNQKEISCIPEGTYQCKKVANRQLFSGAVLLQTFEVMDVPERDGILFHTGNRAINSRGCILLGEGYSMFRDEPWIINSRLAFTSFLLYTEKTTEFSLKISNLKLS